MMPEVNNSSPLQHAVTTTPGCQNCVGCGQPINEKYIYKVLPDMQWHESCLKCCECGSKLEENSTCFIKNSRAYCKQDYSRLFAYKCDRCGVGLNRNDLVMKCLNKLFHIDCFSCSQCHRKLVPGDEYRLKDDQLLCKDDASMLGESKSSAASMPHLTSLLSSSSSNSVVQTMGPSHPLYLSYSSSMMPITPEYSNASVSSPSFSPTTTSSLSSSSSIVDSPSSSNHFSSNLGNLSISSSNNQTGNITASNINFNSSSSSSSVNPSAYSTGSHDQLSTKFDMFNDFDYNIKEEAESASDDENNVDEASGDEEVDGDGDDDDSNLNESMSEESSFNESSGSFGTEKSMSKKAKKKQAAKNDPSSGVKSEKKFKACLPMGTTSSPLMRPNINGHMLQLNQLNQHPYPSQPANRQVKAARIRTVLNEKQLQTLRQCYNANPRPDAILKEHLVEMTGLHPRVIRVWFQNKRCKDKKKNLLVRPEHHHSGLQLPTCNQFHMNPMGSVHHGGLMGPTNTSSGFPQQQQHILYDNCF